MAFRKMEVDVLSCDSCELQVIYEDPADIAGWFTGQVSLHRNLEGDYVNVEWAACKPAHIKNAILSVTEQL